MGTVIMTITADWEGLDLGPGDLQAIKALGTQLSMFGRSFNGKDIPITHFICPAYFTRTLVPRRRDQVATQILSSGAIRDVDEVAVHVHAWESLALVAGIAQADFKSGPRGADREVAQSFSHGAIYGPDQGYTVPLGIYSIEQVKLYLNASINLLSTYLIRDTTSFRTGMWVTCDTIFQALEQTQLRYDASALPFRYEEAYVIPKYGDPYDEWNLSIWGDQPSNDPIYLRNSRSHAQYGQGIYGIGTNTPLLSQPAKVGNIVEIPDTGALLPVTNFALIRDHIKYAFDVAIARNTSIYTSIGFHQESAGKPAFFDPDPSVYPLDTLEKKPNPRVNAIWMAANYAISQSKKNSVGLEFLTIREVGQRFMSLPDA